MGERQKGRRGLPWCGAARRHRSCKPQWGEAERNRNSMQLSIHRGKAYALGESFLRFGWKERLQAVGNISQRTPRTVDDVLELNSDFIVFLGVGGSRFQVQIAASAGC